MAQSQNERKIDFDMTGSELRAARAALGLTQDALAEAIHYNSGRHIRRLEAHAGAIPARAEQLVKNLMESKDAGVLTDF